MINISTLAKQRLATNQRTLFKADFTLDKSNGKNQYITETTRVLRGDDVMSGTVNIEDSSSSQGSLDIGSAIINSLSVTLNNFDDRFALYDFTGATMKVYTGIPLVDNVTDEEDVKQVEWVKKGFYTVDKPNNLGNTIPLTMLDNMSKFERLFKDVKDIVYPITIKELTNKICLYCGVVVGNHVPNPNWTIKEAPSDENLTCLDMIGYIAQINGCYARINTDGYLEFKWYDLSVFKNDETNYDGGTFLTETTPYSDGVNMEGGSFDHSAVPYIDEEGFRRYKYATPTTDYDGGEFEKKDYTILRAFKSFNVGTEDTKITGIQFVVDNLDENAQEPTTTYLYDAQGNITNSETKRRELASIYALEIASNPLMPLLNNLTACMSYVAKKIVGLTFRTFNVSTLSMPQLESGDAVRIVSERGDFYDTFITNTTFSVNNYQNVSCTAKTVSENEGISSSPLTTAIANVKQETRKEMSAYAEGVKMLTSLSANALGFYETSEVDPLTGAKIEYMHDKETLAQSLNAYKKSISGFFIGTRANTSQEFTWISGVTLDGSAVVKVLTAHGINADWINAGSIDANTIEVKNLNASKITSGSIDATKIAVNNLVVGTNVAMGANATIAWSKVTGTKNTSDLNNNSGFINSATATQITKDTVTTAYVNALNVKAGSVDAGNITGTTISGKTLNGGTISGSTKFVMTASGSSQDTELNWGGTWEDSLTVTIKSNVKAGLGVAHKDDKFGRAMYMHYNDIEWYDNSYNPRKAEFGSPIESDIRLKEDVKEADKNIIRDLFKKVNFVSYKYKNQTHKNVYHGMIAQDVEKILDELGFDKEVYMSKDEDGYYKLIYSDFERLGLIAIQDLYEQNEMLKEEVALLKKKLNVE